MWWCCVSEMDLSWIEFRDLEEGRPVSLGYLLGSNYQSLADN